MSLQEDKLSLQETRGKTDRPETETVPKFIACCLYGLLHAVLLDIHVVCVQVDGHIVHANVSYQRLCLQQGAGRTQITRSAPNHKPQNNAQKSNGTESGGVQLKKLHQAASPPDLLRCVEDIGFISVDYLQPIFYAIVSRLCCHLLRHSAPAPISYCPGAAAQEASSMGKKTSRATFSLQGFPGVRPGLRRTFKDATQCFHCSAVSGSLYLSMAPKLTPTKYLPPTTFRACVEQKTDIL